MGALVAVARQIQPHPLAGEARTRGPLQRILAWHSLGRVDAARDDCNLHHHLRGDIQGEVRSQQLKLGLLALSVLRTAAMERISGIYPTFVYHNRESRESGEARRVST